MRGRAAMGTRCGSEAIVARLLVDCLVDLVILMGGRAAIGTRLGRLEDMVIAREQVVVWKRTVTSCLYLFYLRNLLDPKIMHKIVFRYPGVCSKPSHQTKYILRLPFFLEEFMCPRIASTLQRVDERVNPLDDFERPYCPLY